MDLNVFLPHLVVGLQNAPYNGDFYNCPADVAVGLLLVYFLIKRKRTREIRQLYET